MSIIEEEIIQKCKFSDKNWICDNPKSSYYCGTCRCKIKEYGEFCDKSDTEIIYSSKGCVVCYLLIWVIIIILSVFMTYLNFLIWLRQLIW